MLGSEEELEEEHAGKVEEGKQLRVQRGGLWGPQPPLGIFFTWLGGQCDLTFDFFFFFAF